MDFGKLVDEIQFVDRDGTNDGKCSTVSFGHQAWRTIMNHAMNRTSASAQFSCGWVNLRESKRVTSGKRQSDAPTAGYAKDQLLKYFSSTVDTLGEHIEGVDRAGFRETRVVPADDLAPIKDTLVKAFINSGSDFFESLGAPIADLSVIPVVFKHGDNKFQITAGPVTKAELLQYWGDDADLPEKAFYMDVDYYVLQPPGWQGELKARVSEFVYKAQSIQNK